MKKIAMIFLATAIAAPMMFAQGAPKSDTAPDTTKTGKKHKKKKKTAPSFAAGSTAPVK
jgi:hypothetical protein